MGITIGTITSHKVRSNIQTFNHNHSGGDNNILIVCYSSVQNPSSVTYDNVAMNQAVLKTSDGHVSRILYLVNPPSGVHQVKIITSSISNKASAAISLSGVDTDDPIGNTQTAGSASTSTATLDIVSTSPDNIIIDNAAKGFSQLGSIGADQTLIYTLLEGNTAGASSYETGSGTKTMSWTYGADGPYAGTAVEIKALVDANTTDFFRLF